MFSFLFVNGLKNYHFKSKDTERNSYPLCLYKISKGFTVDNMAKTGLYEYAYDFSVDYDSIEVDDVLDIHKYLKIKHNVK